MTQRALIVDDEQPARERLHSLLRELPDVEIVAEAANGEEALQLACRHKPDVVFLDVRMPGMDGLETARHLNTLPEPPAVEGIVEVLGVAELELPQALELKPSPPPAPEQRIWQKLTREAYARWSGLALQPLLIRQTEPARRPGEPHGEDVDAGLVREWHRPGPDVDKHRGYAFQWYALAFVTAGLWLWFVVLAPIRARRAAERAE